MPSIQDDNDRIALEYPSAPVAGHLLHIFYCEGKWSVWLNCEDMEFTGLCIGIGPTRDAAVTMAVNVCEKVAEKLQEMHGV